ncbi:MAG: hypothetical protein R2784_09555 [Saprospiraceae bacterium]
MKEISISVGDQDTSLYRFKCLAQFLPPGRQCSRSYLNWGLKSISETASWYQNLTCGTEQPDLLDAAGFGVLRYLPVQELQLQAGLRYAYNSRFSSPSDLYLTGNGLLLRI